MRRWRSLVLACAAGTLSILASSRALAVSAEERAIAESLFQQGRELMDSGQVAQACDRFSESQRLEAALGTLLNLAGCYEALGKTASAWAEYNRALALAERSGDAERSALAESKVQALHAQLSRVTLRLPPDAPRNTQAWLDGKNLGSGAWGTPVPLDPGSHQLEVRAPNRQSWSAHLLVQPGPSQAVIDIPSPRRIEEPTDASLAAAAPAVEARQNLPSRTAASTAEESQSRPWLWASAGITTLALATGTVAALDLKAQLRTISAHCDERFCDQVGLDADARARRSALIADVSVAAALLGAAATTYLWFSSNDSTRSVAWLPVLSAHTLGLSAVGRY